MPDPIDPAPNPNPEPAPVETPPTVSSFVGEDGTLKEGWQSVLDEGYRDDPVLATVKNFRHLGKITVDTKRMVGKDKIAIPTDASTEAEWGEYHKAGGRPETVEDYNLKAPEGIPEEISSMILPKERLAKWQERFFKGGTSKKAADSYIAAFVQDAMADLQAKEQFEKQEMDELISSLSAEWGAAFEQKKHLGNIALEEGTQGNPELKERLLAKSWWNDPDIVRLISNLGSKFAEGKSPNFANVPTPADLQTQIDKLRADPLFLNGTQAQRMKIANQINALTEKKMAEAKTT